MTSIVASGRLARGDASVAIGVNMHLVAVLSVARRWRMARAAGNARRERAFAESLRAIVSRRRRDRGRDERARAGPHAPGDRRRSRTDGGWRIDGHKIFCTMSPAATIAADVGRLRRRRGRRALRLTSRSPPTRRASRINDDWDALGMRASGSHSVTFDGVELPAAALRGGFPTGEACRTSTAT